MQLIQTAWLVDPPKAWVCSLGLQKNGKNPSAQVVIQGIPCQGQ
jgi:hypothetical protein